MRRLCLYEIINDSQHKVDIEQKLIGWLADSKGLYLQQSGAVVSMLASTQRWDEIPPNATKSLAKIMAPGLSEADVREMMLEKGRFFTSVPEWMNAIETLDMTIGTRIHGNMVSLAAGVPGVLCAHDSRTGELGDTMHIPTISMTDLMGSKVLSEAIGSIRFDGESFDNWRSGVAQAMTEELQKIDLIVSPYVSTLF